MAYSNAVKTRRAGRPEDVLEAHGAVSAQVGDRHGRRRPRSAPGRPGVGVTGVAGPDGGTEAKPVGLVYVAVAGLGDAMVRRFQWPGDRSENKRDSAPRRPSRCCSSAPWTAARSVSGRPRRPAAPVSLLGAAHDRPRRGRGRRRPRARAGAAADRAGRADPRRRRGRGRGIGGGAAGVVGRRRDRRLRPRRPEPVHARPRRRRHQRRAAPRSGARHAAIGRPARLAVTKALTAIDPGNAELAAAREAGIPHRGVAAGRRGRRGRPAAGRDRRDARQEHVGGLARPRPGVGRPGSRGVRRARCCRPP